MSKQFYELSVWDDIPVAAVYSEDTPPKLVTPSYISERRRAIIGGDDFESPLKAYNVTLKEQINGETSLSFSIPYRYYDETSQKLIDNPLFLLLKNETKLKIRDGKPYDFTNLTDLNEEDTEERWKDFLIKGIDKDSTTNTANIVAKEAYVNELGKNGWSVELTAELENNFGILPDLAKKVLDGSDWEVGGYSPIQTTREPLFKAKVLQNLTVSQMVEKVNNQYIEKEANSFFIPIDETIYIFYNSAEYNEETGWTLKQNEDIQILYAGRVFGLDDIDDSRTIINEDYQFNYVAPSVNFTGKIGSLALTGAAIGDIALNGNKIKKSTKESYDPELDKYVSLYKTTPEFPISIPVSEVKEYEETEYITSGIVSNYLSNSTNFSSFNGWVNENKGGPAPSVKLFPDATNITDYEHFNSLNLLALNLSNGNKYLNNGIYISKLKLTAKKKYVIRFRGRWIRRGATSYRETDAANYSIYPNSSPTDFRTLQFQLAGPNGKTYSVTRDAIFPFEKVKCGSSYPDSEKGYLLPVASESERIIEDGENYGCYIDEKGFGYLFVDATANTTEAEEVYLRIAAVTGAPSTDFDFYIENIQFFDYVTYTDANSVDHIVFPNDAPVSIIKNNKYFYYFDTDLDQTVYLPNNESYYTPLYSDNFQSVRRIEIKESNYFNNIQSLAELFEVWVKFKVAHNKSGKIRLRVEDPVYGADIPIDETGKTAEEIEKERIRNLQAKYGPIKEIIFSRYAPNEDNYNYAGFKYGINLDNIKRTVDSASISTKLIVKDNSQELAKNDSNGCSITRAISNPSGENSVLNFDYYINQNLLDTVQVLRDLYGTTNDDFRYIPRLKVINTRINSNSIFLSASELSRDQLEAEYDLYEASKTAATDTMQELAGKMAQLTDHTDSLYLSNKAAYDQAFAKINNYSLYLLELEENINKYKAEITRLTGLIESDRKEKKALQIDFYKKYSRFIQEGTWIDESYIDDELYYLAALQLASTSAYPKISYNIATLEVEGIDGLSAYKFKIGDKTYIEDVEFFGTKRVDVPGAGSAYSPIKMEVIVSERNRNFDDNTKTTITVKNYKDQFEELFQKITATTTALQYQSGAYGRAAGMVGSNGEIEIKALEKSFENNSLILSASNNQSVIWDTGTGIEVINNENTSERVRVVGAGIFISTDGGATWRNAINGNGINATYLATGQIDTSKINIMSNNIPYFRWDSSGINAFEVIDSSYNTNKYVQFSQYGLFGTKNGKTLEAAIGAAGTPQDKLAAVKANSTFSLTWDGLQIKGQDGSVSLNPVDGLEIFNGSTFTEENLATAGYITNPSGANYIAGDKIPVLSLGKFKNFAGGQDFYGLRMRNSNGRITLSTDAVGQFWVNDQIYVGEDFTQSEFGGVVSIAGLSGRTITEDQYNSYIMEKRYNLNLDYAVPETEGVEFLRQNSVRIWAGAPSNNIEASPFFVLENGLMYASNAYIEGLVHARAGQFSGFIMVGPNSNNGIDGTTSSEAVFWGGRVNTVDEDGNLLSADYKFRVDSEGKIFAKDATISGTVRATAGSIEELSIGKNSGIGINPYVNGVTLWINASTTDKTTSAFYVTNNGELYASDIYLRKSILIGEEKIIDNLDNTRYYTAGINKESSNLIMWAGATSNDYGEALFTIDQNGLVTAKNLNLGAGTLKANGAILTGSLKLSNDNGQRGLLLSGDNGISTIPFSQEGNTGWAINADGNAYFNNISARGELKSVTFAYDSRNILGGDLSISPSHYFSQTGYLIVDGTDSEPSIIFEVNKTAYDNEIWGANPEQADTLGEAVNILFNCTLSTGEKFQELKGFACKKYVLSIPNDLTSAKYYFKIIILKNNNNNPEEMLRKGNQMDKWLSGSIIDPGSSITLANGCGINLTSGDGSGPSVIITDTNGVIVQLGRLGGDSRTPAVVDEYFGELSGYGLYAQNAYLTGRLFLPNAGITNEDFEYSGANKIGSGEGQKVRIWAGESPDSSLRNQAPFVVTQDGTLYASKGIFAGQVIAENSIFSGWLTTAGILIDPDEDTDTTKSVFYVAYDGPDRTSLGIPPINDRIIQIDRHGLSIWEGGLSVYSDWAAGWTDTGENGPLEDLYGPVIISGGKDYSSVYPYIKAIDDEDHRIYISNFHSSHFTKEVIDDDTFITSNSIKIKDGILQFSRYINSTESDFEIIEKNSFNSSTDSWNIKLDNNTLKIYPFKMDDNNQEIEGGYLKFKNATRDEEIHVEVKGLLEVSEQITLTKGINSKPKINFPNVFIQHHNSYEDKEWDNGIDFVI